jgi:hypothetical protein
MIYNIPMVIEGASDRAWQRSGDSGDSNEMIRRESSDLILIQ